MKPTSEDAKITAGNAPRRDSAEAAALTVGSPSSSSSSQTAPLGSAPKRTSLSLATRAGIAALAVVSVLFIGASAFALTNGFGLPADSPVVKAAESVGIVRSVDVEPHLPTVPTRRRLARAKIRTKPMRPIKNPKTRKTRRVTLLEATSRNRRAMGHRLTTRPPVGLPIQARAPLHPRAAARLRALVRGRALLPRAPLQARVLRRVALRNRALPHLPAR